MSVLGESMTIATTVTAVMFTFGMAVLAVIFFS
jgi:hypothetical protein